MICPYSFPRRWKCVVVARHVALFAAISVFFFGFGTQLTFASDDHNPIGVAGAFEGMITTGCAYNVLNHNARREVDDIVVPGAIGKYGLKMTRYYNSRRTTYGGMMGPGWTHEYMWVSGNDKIEHPGGDAWDSHCTGDWGLPGPLGVSEWPITSNGSPAFRLADGGTVVFENPNFGVATKIIDPYGQVTTITLDGAGKITQVIEPGGRYLKFIYSSVCGPHLGCQTMLTGVDAYDGVTGHPRIDWVVYNYAEKSTGGAIVQWAMCLTQVDYSDGTSHAKYTWQEDNQPEHPNQPCPCMIRLLPLVIGCDDVRYHGPMRRVAYKYPDPTAHGAHGDLIKEMYWDGVPGHEGDGPMVSKIDPPAPSPLDAGVTFPISYTEYRGDGPTRRFTYTPLSLGRSQGGDPDPCPSFNGPAPQQFLQSYTDFKTPGNSTQLGYDTNWYINSVTDADGHWTQYQRGSPPYAYPGPKGIGEIQKITHQDGTHIDYIYYDESPDISGHYLKQITNERGSSGSKIYHYRDAQHRIYRTDYRDANDNVIAFEAFAYNAFGQVTIHQLKNGAYDYFQYDNRGLLIKRWNPTTTVAYPPSDSLPHTTYTYYTATDGKPGWIDRVKTMTLPANAQGLHASETYEYDLSATNFSRGLVTKITHADGKYQSFFYDVYGNRLWEKNELFKQTSYTYDEYNRVLTVKDPIGQTTGHQTTFTYKPTNGTDWRLHTTNNPDTVTTAAGILTTNVYDENFRKKSTTVGSSTTIFDYDNVGNLTDVTDPRGKITHNGYDNRNRKTSTTEAYQTSLAATTAWHYDGASNINQIDRPDGQHETRGYDALNRMNWQNVKRQIAGTNESEDLTTGFGYWPSGKLLWVQDPNHWGGSLATHFFYNESDELITMYYPDQSIQSWTYDDAHNLASRTTVHGAPETQRFTYDIRNRKTGMSWDNGADSASFSYDDVGRLLTANNLNSNVTRVYDAAGRLTQDLQTVTGLGAKNVTYPLYDDDGRLKQIQLSGAYDYTFDYDSMGRFVTITPTGGSVGFRYSYDAASNVTHRYTYPSGSVTLDQQTPPDSLNRISSRWIYKNGSPLAGAAEGYTYDHMNRLTKVDRGSIYDWFGYYWDSELAACAYGVPQAAPGQPQAGQDPDLDTDGSTDPWAGYQPPEVAEPERPSPTPRGGGTPHPRPTPPPTPTPAPTQTPTPPPFPNTAYVYDGTGNRLWVVDTVNGGRDYVPDDLNRYTSIVGSTINNGNEHEVSSYKGPSDARLVNYSYLNDEHLVSVNDGTGGGANHYNLAYDALGRCVKRTLNGATTYYIYDDEKPILEYGPNNALAKNLYGKGIDEIVMRTDSTVNSGAAFYYGQDHEGSVTHLINASGNVIESYRYDAYGAPAMYNGAGTQIASTAYNNRFLFTGREYAATYQKNYVPTFNFYEYRARAYQPSLGRFMSEDHKLANTGDYNLFRYCHNDPIDNVDPMGLQDTVATYSAQQTSLLKAEEQYARAMGAAQWAMTTTNLAGSTTAAGMAGYALNQLSQPRSASFNIKAEIREPDRQAGIKTSQTVTVNPDGTWSEKAYAGSTKFLGFDIPGVFLHSANVTRTGTSTYDVAMKGYAVSVPLMGAAGGVVGPVNAQLLGSIHYSFHGTANFSSHAASLAGWHSSYPSFVGGIGGRTVFDRMQSRPPLVGLFPGAEVWDRGASGF
jgi:RHS repeat-associated protein